MDNKPKRIFGIERNVFFLGLVSLFNDFSSAMIQSIMPYFLSVTLGIPKVGVGLIEGTANVIASFMRIFSGWFSDQIKKRKSLSVIGYALSTLTRPLFLLIHSAAQVGLVRTIDRIGKGFRDSPRDALLASSVPLEELGKSFGYQRAMDAIGGFLGPIGAFITLFFFLNDYKVLFIVSFVIGLLAVSSFAFVREVPPAKDEGKVKFSLSILKTNRNFLLFIVAVFIFGMGTIPEVLMFVRPVELGFGLATIPIVYFIYNGIFGIFAGPIGKLSDRIGQRKVIGGGFFLAIPACFILAFTSDIPSAIFAFILMGFYSAATDGIERALASKLIEHKFLATGEGVLQAAIGLSSLLSAVIGGLLWDRFGYMGAFVYWGIASTVGFALFVYISMKANGISKRPEPYDLKELK